MSRATTVSCEELQVAPTIRTVEFADGAIEPLSSEGLVESVGRIGRLPEEEHRRDATLKEPTSHAAQQESAEAMTMEATQHVNLVQLAHESRHATIVQGALRKADQLAGIVFDDEAKPASVLG